MQTLVFGFVLVTILVFVQTAPIDQTNQNFQRSPDTKVQNPIDSNDIRSFTENEMKANTLKRLAEGQRHEERRKRNLFTDENHGEEPISESSDEDDNEENPSDDLGALDAYRLFLNRAARTIFDATDYGTFDLPDYELYYTRQPSLFGESIQWRTLRPLDSPPSYYGEDDIGDLHFLYRSNPDIDDPMDFYRF